VRFGSASFSSEFTSAGGMGVNESDPNDMRKGNGKAVFSA